MTASELPASDPSEMGFFEHLGELRQRLIVCVVTIVVLAGLSFGFSQELFSILCAPFSDAFEGKELIGTGPAEAFILRIKIAFLAGTILASPVLFYQLWAFIAPGLYEHERGLMLPFVAATTLCFLLGAAFSYKVILPFAYQFFKEQYLSIGVEPTIRISEHLSVIIKAILGFGFVFELPVIAFLLGRVGVITDQTLIHGGRYAIVAIFVVAAALTPPDILTQALMAGPLILLYGLSILLVRWTGKPAEIMEEPEQQEDSSGSEQ